MFKLSFKTGNVAFEDGNKEQEIARILEEIANKILNGYDSGKVMDINGNSIGSWSVD